MNQLRLSGCRPEPLGSYLKSLGVVRLLSRQKDPDLRCWWDGDSLCLQTALTRQQVCEFFALEYRPTPVVAPWNGGSGFYEGDACQGRDAILASQGPRFSAYRDCIRQIMDWPEMPPVGLSLGKILERLASAAQRARGKKQEGFQGLINDVEAEIARTPELRQQLLAAAPDSLSTIMKSKALMNAAKKARTQVNQLSRSAGKEALIDLCRGRLSEEALEWIDCVVMLNADGEAEYPPLVGTGGNDGRLEYTNAQMQALADMLLPEPQPKAVQLVECSLFGASVSGLSAAPIGQFDPGRAGGFNQGHGIKGETPLNPWDYVLVFEGAPVWASSIVRRHSAGGGSFLSSPFTVLARSVGYGSASPLEQARAEVWAPLWTQPLQLAELRAFFGEGRAEVGGRRARDGMQFAQAVCSLGVDRGVQEFVRYSMLERRGKSYVSLPTGRFLVNQNRREADFARELQTALAPLDSWIRMAFKNEPPANLKSARWSVDRAIFEMLARGGSDASLRVFLTLGHLESWLSCRSASKLPARPPGGLSARWVADLLGNDESVELRLAVALASILGGKHSGSLRCNWAPVDPARPGSWTVAGGRQAWQGNSLAVRMLRTLRRRILDWQGQDESERHWNRAAVPCFAQDAVCFLLDEVDESLLELLTLGLSWIDWRNYEQTSLLHGLWKKPAVAQIVPRAYGLLKLSCWGKLKRDEEIFEISTDPTILGLLESHQLERACELAALRLYTAGLSPFRVRYRDSLDPVRLAASLLIPIFDSQSLLKRVTQSTAKELL